MLSLLHIILLEVIMLSLLHEEAIWQSMAAKFIAVDDCL